MDVKGNHPKADVGADDLEQAVVLSMHKPYDFKDFLLVFKRIYINVYPYHVFLFLCLLVFLFPPIIIIHHLLLLTTTNRYYTKPTTTKQQLLFF